jgi:hypothetical protein
MDIQHVVRDKPFEEHSSCYVFVVVAALFFLHPRLYQILNSKYYRYTYILPVISAQYNSFVYQSLVYHFHNYLAGVSSIEDSENYYY